MKDIPHELPVGVTRRDGLSVLLVAGAGLLSGCGDMFSTSYRFRMTVEVDTPQGMRSGSSVLQVSSSKNSVRIAGTNALSTGLRGEAVAVDISPGQTLFGLTGSSNGGLAGAVTLLFEPNYTGPESFVASVRKLGRSDEVGRTAALPPKDYPKLVRFRDALDPASVEAVDPANLAMSFKLGVSLKSIFVEIVQEPISNGIQKRLPWLPDYYDKLLDGKRYNNSVQLANNLGSGSFSSELSR